MVDARREHLMLPAQPESVPAGRHFLTMMLREWDLAVLIEAVGLAASEVLTNAVVHARTAFEVTLLARADLTVEVRDTCTAWVGSLPAARLPHVQAEGGRGLALVQAVSDEWGVRPDAGGKTVWFSVALP